MTSIATVNSFSAPEETRSPLRPVGMATKYGMKTDAIIAITIQKAMMFRGDQKCSCPSFGFTPAWMTAGRFDCSDIAGLLEV